MSFMLLTLAIAVYNSEKYLPLMLESILTQTFIDYELLLLDDGSNDGSGDLCDSYAERDNRVKVVHKKNTGLCASRNLAIELAEGDFICFLDHDDRIFPGMLEAFARAIAENYADFYVNGYRIRIENIHGKIVGDHTIEITEIFLKTSQEVRQFYLDNLGGIVSPVWNCVFSMKYLKKNNLKFDETLNMSLDDLAFHINSYFVANSVYVLSNVGNEYYVRGTSSSRKYNPKLNMQCKEILNKLRNKISDADMETKQNILRYYEFNFRLLVISGLQNIVYARKILGRKATHQNIKKLCSDPMTIETINSLKVCQHFSFYERILYDNIRSQYYNIIYKVIVLKDKIRMSQFLSIAKKIIGQKKEK